MENASSRVAFTRDFPLGCGNLMPVNSPLKISYTYTRDYPPDCGPNASKITPFLSEKNSGLRENPGSGHGSFKCKPTGRQMEMGSGSGRKMVMQKPSKVKYLDSSGGRVLGSQSNAPKMNPIRSEKDSGRKPRDFGGESSGEGRSNESNEREKVVEMLRLFRERCDELSRKGVKRVDIEANRELTREGKIIKAQHKIGSIPGVEVGDKFYYRIELVIAGLHRLFQGGIDTKEEGGERFATCIVANEGHLDKMSDPNLLSYIGEGGTRKPNEVGDPPDQTLTAGNLALHNSRLRNKAVRVVRGLRYGSGNAKIVYVYDGLYKVTETVRKKGPQGNLVFEFRMTRDAGQPVVPWREYKRQFA
ncbi:histone-lysine N-methyltransferase, H3 lysine-9 specific SUVH5-like [Silene latifolia]|uniref:histone-lysine N-methyltransferase, H3 lysine-9 specific SUVH5-like n=1 Tax=Silene latifolia TaxID=37657 RepID=UPI003D788FBC